MTKFILHFLENIFTSIIYYYSVIYNTFFRFVAQIWQLWQFSRCETSMFHDIYIVFVSFPAIYTLASLQVVVILFVR